jgi:hypothetical protein
MTGSSVELQASMLSVLDWYTKSDSECLSF